MTRDQKRALLVTALATLAAALMLTGCMTPDAIDYHQRHPEYRLMRYKGRLTYPIMLDPYNVPLEIVRQMTEDEYRIWMEGLREMGKQK